MKNKIGSKISLGGPLIVFLGLALSSWLGGCAKNTLSKNYVQQSTALLRGGVFETEQWNDTLQFQRVSWYREFSMVYDFFLTQIDEKSRFYQWFSKSEKKLAQSCQKFFVSMSYSQNRFNRSFIDHRQLQNQMAKSSFVTYPHRKLVVSVI